MAFQVTLMSLKKQDVLSAMDSLALRPNVSDIMFAASSVSAEMFRSNHLFQYAFRYNCFKLALLSISSTALYVFAKKHENSEAIWKNKTRLKWLKKMIYGRVSLFILKNILHAFKGDKRNKFVRYDSFLIHVCYISLIHMLNIKVVWGRESKPKNGPDQFFPRDVLIFLLFVIARIIATVIMYKHILFNKIEKENPIWRLYQCSDWVSVAAMFVFTSDYSWYLPYLFGHTAMFVADTQKLLKWKKDVVLIVYAIICYKLRPWSKTKLDYIYDHYASQLVTYAQNH